MTKKEAISAMKEGKKVTHKYFTPDEWMTIEDNEIVLEDGCRCDIDEFFSYRNYTAFDDGFYIYKEK